jgi:Tfp pilus assembly protein PilN
MRPVNLIPLDERRGSARVGADRAPVRVYIVLGMLGVALLAVLAVVLTSNQINSRTEDLSKVQAKEQGVKQVADALRPFGQFAQVEAARKAQIDQLASTRFNWEGALRQLSRAIPANVWLLNLSGTVSPSIQVEATAGGGAASLRDKYPAPAIAMSGCTFSQHAVARMMSRMQNLDDVTDVELAKSARKDEATTPSSATASASSASSASQDQTDCVGSSRVTQFDMLVVFGGSPIASASAGGGTAAAAGTPNSTAQNATNAQSAVSTANNASSSAAGSSGGTP